MEPTASDRTKKLLERGMMLPNTGLPAFTPIQIIELFRSLELDGIAVLGGDVIYQSNVGVLVGSESWHCDRGTRESYGEYTARSIKTAEDYISAFRYDGPLQVLFAPVLSCEE